MAKKIFITSLVLILGATSIYAQTFKRLVRRANTSYEIHAYNKAIEDYQAALQKNADDPEALFKIADSYRQLNKMDEAAAFYARAVRQSEVDKASILQYGLVLKSLGRYDEAKQWFLLYARDVDAQVGNHFAQTCDFAKAQMNVNASYSVSNEFINTSAADFGPAFWGTDRVVYSSARTDIQRSGGDFSGKIGNQLFLATIGTRGYLESPVFLKAGNQQEYNEGPISLAPDGRTVAFSKNNFVDGTRQIPGSGMEMSIYLAQINPNGTWGDIRPFPFNGTGFSSGYPCFSPDGNTLFFASDRPDGFGGYDLYASSKVGNTWSAPENLGPVVNTSGDEISPFFDGNSLFFSSNWHPGLGGMDVFRAESTGNRWTRIFHLGAQVNSARDDYGFVYDAFRNLGFLVSNRLGGRGNEDIYRLTRASDNVTIRVMNAANGLPVGNAIVDFTSCGQGTYQTDGRGVYSFQALQGLACDVVVNATGFLPGNVKISTGGVNGSRDYQVMLTSPNDAYAGKIVDYTSRLPLEGVIITATNKRTGNRMEAFTNSNGDYYLALSPFSDYLIRYSKIAYREIDFDVNTQDGLDRTILGVISLLPSTAVPPSDGNPGNTGPVRPDDNPSVALDGFAVQVAAIGTPAMDRFGNLTDLGDVYYLAQNGTYKIRLGVYATRQDADMALRQVKSRGYPGAFVVREQGGGDVGVRNPNEGTSNQGQGGFGRFKVQLAAYSNPKWFDDSKVRNLGVIEDGKKGRFTIKYIGGLSSLEEARRALSVARSAGFDTSFIVEDVNGELVKRQ
ncbi:MAG: SPOR domain-containing protein [Saprospiraceae bacterium]